VLIIYIYIYIYICQTLSCLRTNLKKVVNQRKALKKDEANHECVKKKITIISGFKREIESLKQVEGKKLPNHFSFFFCFFQLSGLDLVNIKWPNPMQ
jgi:hypothetical protein